MMRALILVLILAGCTSGAPESDTQRATAAACREQANTTFNVQNRDQIYNIYQPYAPQSGIGMLDNPTRQLSNSYAQEEMISNCIRNTGTGADRELPGGPAPPPARPNPAPSGQSMSR